MDTPPPPPLPPPHDPVPPPPEPPVLPPAPHPVPAPAMPPVVPPPGSAVTDRMLAAFKSINWQQLGADCKVFGKRFVTGDFALIQPGPTEHAAVAGQTPRMASLIVWRRALLFMAAVLSVILFIKTCFDPHTFRSLTMKSTLEKVARENPGMSPADRYKTAENEVDEGIKVMGEGNIVVFDTLLVGTWCCIIASTVFQILAAFHWRDFRRSRRFALIGVGALVVPQVAAMVFPWSSLMNFSHLERQLVAQGTAAEMVKWQMLIAVGIYQATMALFLLQMTVPIFYSLFTGILRATLTAKTLIPASIVCGWSTLLLALTIAVPWFCVLSLASQFQADAILILGCICLLAAPLSLVFKSRRLGAPLSPAEATPVVRKARLLFSGLNFAGAAMIIAFAMDKKWLEAGDLVSAVMQYFAHLMLITVAAVDMLVLLLNRAHHKLAGDENPEEPLRQLGEVLPRPQTAPVAVPTV